MNYKNTKNERESDSKRSAGAYFSTKQKRLVALLMLTLCLLFAGARSTPSAVASLQCPLVCSEPYTDPVDGQCYVDCCPADPKSKCACERFPCK
jgi:hypothetical protein